MSEFEVFGRQLRGLLTGLLSVPSAPQASAAGDIGRGLTWGQRINTAGLRDLYAPQTIKPFTATPGGIDNLVLTSRDVIEIPGMGEFVLNFGGYFRVARDNPTTSDWATCNVHVNMLDMKLESSSEPFGRVTVRLNPDFVSAGQTFPPDAGNPAAAGKCRIATAAVFEMSKQKMAVFNKEPILLMNDEIESIPPVEDPDGAAHIYRLPLFDVQHPDAKPVAYLKSLHYTVGNYIEEARARDIDQRFA